MGCGIFKMIGLSRHNAFYGEEIKHCFTLRKNFVDRLAKIVLCCK